MRYSEDYHDYVFKNGKLLGKFEEMYKFSKETPWHQDKTAQELFSNIDITILSQQKYNTILDVGCGLGYFTNRLYTELKNAGGVSHWSSGSI
jgi:2-polyprenyl-3-methyl-5-hydroxy-6-metoxy-1,4-benzoquinol methylase